MTTPTIPVKNPVTTNPIHIRMPNYTIAASTHEGELAWPDIPEAVRKFTSFLILLTNH